MSDRRHVLPIWAKNMGPLEASPVVVLKTEQIGLHQTMQIERDYPTATSDFNFLKILLIGGKYQFFTYKVFWEIYEFSKTGISVMNTC